MNLEDLAVRRADEQLARGAWKNRDRDESIRGELVHFCEVPGCDNVIPRGPKYRKTCDYCQSRGLVGVACKGCGGPVRRNDQTSPPKDRRGYCQSCRSGMSRIERGAETLVIARAALAARRAA